MKPCITKRMEEVDDITMENDLYSNPGLLVFGHPHFSIILKAIVKNQLNGKIICDKRSYPFLIKIDAKEYTKFIEKQRNMSFIEKIKNNIIAFFQKKENKFLEEIQEVQTERMKFLAGLDSRLSISDIDLIIEPNEKVIVRTPNTDKLLTSEQIKKWKKLLKPSSLTKNEKKIVREKLNKKVYFGTKKAVNKERKD